MRIFSKILDQLKTGDYYVRIIILNVLVTLLLNILYSILYITGVGNSSVILDLLAVNPSLTQLLSSPWSLFTYMFTHIDVMHLIVNLYALFWFGKIFTAYIGNKQLLSTYIIGGISGAILFILIFNLSPQFSEIENSPMVGASASILAIIFAIAVYAPYHEVNLIVLGRVKIIYIALAALLYAIAGVRGVNAGGEIAHIGGSLYGVLYGYLLKRSVNINLPFERFISYILLQILKLKEMIAGDRRKVDRVKSKAIDDILKKVSNGGYESLTAEEKRELFKRQ